MILKRPEPSDSGLTLIESTDSIEALLSYVSPRTMGGKLIGDLYLSWKSFEDWVEMVKADELMPFFYSDKLVNYPYRFWWLSRQPTEENKRRKVYKGCWFDIKVALKGGRQYIRFVKLSPNAIKCLTEYEPVFEEIYG